MKDLIIAWQDSLTRRWHPVARLGRTESGRYYFVYTEGAKESPNFEPFGRMTDLHAVYLGEQIFPLFANRMLPRSRPDFKAYIGWLGLKEQELDELEVLGRSGGIRATDNLELFPCPAPDEHGRYVGYFFVHGLRYLLPEHIQRLNILHAGNRLFVVRDIQNPADADALLLRTADPVSLIGYCPRYLAAEFGNFIDVVGAAEFRVIVEQLNADAPYDLRVLCKVESPWPHGYEPCSHGPYKPLVDMQKLNQADKNRAVSHIVG
jgi:hypothetical protein